jgi:hypothetical protein
MRQALEIIRELGPIIAKAEQRGIKREDFERWGAEELSYLEGLQKEPEVDTIKCLYVEVLNKLWAAE